MAQSFQSLFKYRSAAAALLLAAGVAMALAGCGGAEGPTTYQLSGTVTYAGQPVPIGTVTLSPDAAKGNRGPGSAAGIVDGRFATEPGKGHVGGAYVLQVSGYDGVPVEGGEGIDTMGTEMFSLFEVQVELPQADAEQNIEIPGEQADGS
jgi:hypothetical protein